MADAMREAILEQARADARQIIGEAEAKATHLTAAASQQKEHEQEVKRTEILTSAARQAATILARARFEAAKLLEGEKRVVVDEIIATAKAELRQALPDRQTLQQLVTEAIGVFGADCKVRLMVRPRDVASAKDVIRDSALSRRVVEVLEMDCLGGVRVESVDGMVAIDNTFDTRLEMILPHLLPGIAARIFGARPK